MKRISLKNRIVDHGGNQIDRTRQRVHVAGKMQIDFFARFDRHLPSARRAAFKAENRTERRFSQTQQALFADPVQSVVQRDRHRRLSFAEFSRRDGGDEDEFSVRFFAQRFVQRQIDFRLVLSVRFDILPVDARLAGDFFNSFQFHTLSSPLLYPLRQKIMTFASLSAQNPTLLPATRTS